MAYSLSEINSRAASDPGEFIAACDAVYYQKIAQAADKIADNLKHSPIVLLSGPSGSGKTTTAMKIEEELTRRGIRTHTISMDNYFRTMNPKTAPRTPEGDVDYESPLCMDMELLNEHFTRLTKGEKILVPKFEFARQMRILKASKTLRLGKDEIAIFEGIHALNDDITGAHPEAFKLYISARSNIMDGDQMVFKGTWMRLMRRTVRDHLFRGTAAMETLKMWANVRRGEKLYISPFKDKADLQFDTSFPYEVSVLGGMAGDLFDAVPEGTERFEELHSIIPALEHFVKIDPALLAPDSLLREFIGGGVYEY
jgi:uridine kinase